MLGQRDDLNKMRRLDRFFVLGLTLLSASPVLAQRTQLDQFERGIRPHPGGPKGYITGVPGSADLVIRVFSLNNVQYWARISEEALLSAPDWTPSKPLPLDFTNAEAIARTQLRNLVADDAGWKVTGFHLCSAQLTAPDPDKLGARINLRRAWYFQVEMKPVTSPPPRGDGQRSDSFWVFIDLSGKPGTIEPRK